MRSEACKYYNYWSCVSSKSYSILAHQTVLYNMYCGKCKVGLQVVGGDGEKSKENTMEEGYIHLNNNFIVYQKD